VIARIALIVRIAVIVRVVVIVIFPLLLPKWPGGEDVA